MVIREATDQDLNRLAVLNAFVQDDHAASRPDHFAASNIAVLSEAIGHHLQEATSRIWIAQVGELSVGYVLAIWRERGADTFCHARRWCEIDQIVVDPAFRRRGVAKALVIAATDAAAAEGINDVELNTWAFNSDAQDVFRQLGFRPKMIRWEASKGALARSHAELSNAADSR